MSAEIAVLVVWSPSARVTESVTLTLAAGGIDALRRRGYAGRKR